MSGQFITATATRMFTSASPNRNRTGSTRAPSRTRPRSARRSKCARSGQLDSFSVDGFAHARIAQRARLLVPLVVPVRVTGDADAGMRHQLGDAGVVVEQLDDPRGGEMPGLRDADGAFVSRVYPARQRGIIRATAHNWQWQRGRSDDPALRAG